MRTTSIMKKPSLKFLISIAAITVISIGVSGALTAPKYKIAANAPAYDYSKLHPAALKTELMKKWLTKFMTR